MTKQVLNWLLRAAFVMARPRTSGSGFVLPTTVLLILVVSLSVGALTYRAFTRNTQVITQNQQRVIYNAATPAIDRARSKLEFMFDASKDIRYPGGVVPNEQQLLRMMLNDDATGLGPITLPTATDPYTLKDETRVNLDTDNGVMPGRDNAWSFEADTDNDGKDDATVVYSIIFKTPDGGGGLNFQQQLVKLTDNEKAQAQVVRHGPLTTATGGACKVSAEGGNADALSKKWFEDPSNTSIVRKNFQVDVLVVPHSSKQAAVTLEFQQDRQIAKGNKWAAWFRNDLEVFPGPLMQWNGAMHTEGNFMAQGAFQAYLISSKESCLYPPIENSEITITEVKDSKTGEDFAGVVAAGRIGREDNDSSFILHYQNGQTPTPVTISRSNDASNTGKSLAAIYSDPVKILTEDIRITAAGTNNRDNLRWTELPAAVRETNKRLRQNQEPTPYIDDLSRADDRWGPKAKYKDDLVPPGEYGKAISAKPDLTRNENAVKNQREVDRTDEAVGLDGYWERRARNEGLRVIVGERLELGNLFGWEMPTDKDNDNYINRATGDKEGDPLYPPEVAPYPLPSGKTVKHLTQQHRTLRDNLAAVQATAIYHIDQAKSLGTKDYPVACLASTSHPGTPDTLRKSIDFVPTRFTDDSGKRREVMTDFFTGRGTNGWEFEPPMGTDAQFKAALASGQPLRIALDNLAHFAGDPKGAFPPVQDGTMHSYPALTMWGNFSNLRRALDNLQSSGYDSLSIADKTYIQTAACTVGMLAYQVDAVQHFDLRKNDALLQQLGEDLYSLMNGDLKDGDESGKGGEVLPSVQMKSYSFKRGSGKSSAYEPRDYYDVPAEAYLEALRQRYTAETDAVNAVNNDKLRLAEAILLKFQIRRDRTFGFRPSPIFGHYAVTDVGDTNPRVRVFPTACDPDEFGLVRTSPPPSLTSWDAASDDARWRLGLSRLCGSMKLPDNYDLSSDTPPTQRPVVLPKFPSLYYLFPEVDHDLQGETNFNVGAGNVQIPDEPGEYDLRQPVKSLFTNNEPLNDSLLPTGQNLLEPYASDSYNKTAATGFTFKRVQSTSPVQTAATYFNNANSETEKKLNPYLGSVLPRSVPSALQDGAPAPTGFDARFPATNRSVFPFDDFPVDALVTKPRRLGEYPTGAQAWTLPTSDSLTGSNNKINTPTNIIEVPQRRGRFVLVQKPYAVPFLERVLFDGRQFMATRVLDMDLGMMRSKRFTVNGEFNEPVLPMSGIVFAFREDAVREDAISRPAGSWMTTQNPADPKDPPKYASGISDKSVDYFADPERRPHGFRLRNGAQIKRNDDIVQAPFTKTDNYRGLSLFTDQPVYIQGDLNLHQTGDDDKVGTALEEFRGENALIRGKQFTFAQFYDRGKTGNGEKDPDFAQADKDRWRPTEVLADSISILSDNFCDGSVSDLFVAYDGAQQRPFSVNIDTVTTDRGVYHDAPSFKETGLYSFGCSQKGYTPTSNETGYTSFRNSDHPISSLPTKKDRGRYDWVRENPNRTSYTEKLIDTSGYDPNTDPAGDPATPIRISRAGFPLIRAALPTQPVSPSPCTAPNELTTGTKIKCQMLEDSIHFYGDPDDSDSSVKSLKFQTATPSSIRPVLIEASKTNVNAIIVSGIVPSQSGQSYGGLHNFPRFIEKWGEGTTNGFNQILDYAGSFLQLSFSNYATAPWELEGWEKDSSGTLSTPLDKEKEFIGYYAPPLRTWGYDVALQLAPAGPAASRFVVTTPSRNEFYSEPQVNDPYIQTLCKAAKSASVKGSANLNCAA